MAIRTRRRKRRKRAVEPVCPPSFAEAGLQHPFASVRKLNFSEILDHKRAAHLKNAAKAWGAADVKGFTIPDSQAHLKQVWGTASEVRGFLERCSPQVRTVLGIVKLHGGRLRGTILTVEAEVRGLVEKDVRRKDWSSTLSARPTRNDSDPVTAMIGALALVPVGGPLGSLDKRFPDVVLNPALEALVEPAMRIPWPGEVLEEPKKTPARALEQVAEEFDRIADYLIGRRSFPVNKHGWPTKPVLKNIAKALGVPSTEPWSVHDERASRRGDWKDEKKKYRAFSRTILSLEEPHPLPQPEGLLGGLLFQSRLVEIDPPRRRGRLLRKTWEEFKNLSAEERACIWFRSWLEMLLWQDGIGLVPDEDDKYLPERIAPWDLVPSKHTLLWGLSLLPRWGWVTLDDFLQHLHRLTRSHYGLSLCWRRFVWGPKNMVAPSRAAGLTGDEWRTACWLGTEGTWVANVLLVTFTWLGLVERGEIGTGKERRYVFRLSEPVRSLLEGQ